MRPSDLAAEREHRTRKAYQAVACDIRHAYIHATPAEIIGLNHLLDDCQARTITPDEAKEHVIRLRRDQAERSSARAA